MKRQIYRFCQSSSWSYFEKLQEMTWSGFVFRTDTDLLGISFDTHFGFVISLGAVVDRVE